MTYVLGLDFGTSFTAAAALDLHAAPTSAPRVVTLGNRSASVPSVVLVRSDGTLLYGEDAQQRGISEPDRLVRGLKQRLGDPAGIVVGGQRFDNEELIAGYLSWMVERITTREGGRPAHTVLTHPANWRAPRIEAFRRVAERAGLAEATFAVEPVAAASFQTHGRPIGPTATIAVYDLGGTAFMAAVLRRTPATVGTAPFTLAGDPEAIEHLGGADFDDNVRQLVQGKLGDAWSTITASPTGLADLRRECVAAKEALSTDEAVEVPVIVAGAPPSVALSRREFEQVIRSSIAETVGVLRRASRQAGVDPTSLDAVLLVGGSCQIPLVRQMVREAVGAGVQLLETDPKHAVARGAALLAAESVQAVEPPVPMQPPPPAIVAPPPTTPPPTNPPVAPPEAAGQRSRVPVVAAVIAAAVLVAAFAYSRRGNDNIATSSTTSAVAPTSTTATSTAPPSSTAPQTTTAAVPTTASTVAANTGAAVVTGPSSPERMVRIPSGPYRLGTATPSSESVATLQVSLKEFFIDVTEVPNADYNRFVQTLQAPAASSWPRGRMPEEKADHPVTGIEWEWAQAYCVALNKRLPTEAEWESAARGTDGRVFPWGSDGALVDLETPGTRPVGSLGANVSPFGVKDTVGGVWEWVGDPYVKVGELERVRRGGEYGRVRDGVAFRQHVDPTNVATISETGFRCATDTVDPAVAFGRFGSDHALPKPSASKPVTTAAAGSALVNETFENKTSGWPDRADPIGKVGYHAPSWYHVEVARARASTIALGGFNMSDVVVETAVHVDKTDTPSGQFRYGIVVRAHGAQRAGPLAGVGNARPENYYAFVVDPRAGQWLLLHEDNRPQRVRASGALPAPLRTTDPANPDVLRVEMQGSILNFAVNGQQVATFNTDGYHLDGDIGFYVDTLDETKAHVHFDRLTITAQ